MAVATACTVYITAFISVFLPQRYNVLPRFGGVAGAHPRRTPTPGVETCYFVLGGSIACIAQFMQ